MRPISTQRSFVRFPLDELLGTQAHVRLLRVLCDDAGGPISAPEAARRTGLTDAGARRALGRLVRTGFVVRVGEGRSQRFGLRADTVTDGLSTLFEIERRRFERLSSALRGIADDFPEVRTAWIEQLPTETGEPLDLNLLTDAASLPGLTGAMRPRILPIEREFDVTIELHAFTDADAPEVDWTGVILVAGAPPFQERRVAEGPFTHAEREARSLRLSRAVVRLLERDSSLISRAMHHVDRLLRDDPGAAVHDMLEWKGILESYSPERLKSFLVSTTPRAVRLRQSSPFFAVLTPDERDHVLASLELP